MYNLTEKDSIPMIPSSLVVTYKYNEEPPIISLIQRYKHHYDKSNLDIAYQEWLSDYISQLLGIVILYMLNMALHLKHIYKIQFQRLTPMDD